MSRNETIKTVIDIMYMSCDNYACKMCVFCWGYVECFCVLVQCCLMFVGCPLSPGCVS
jgi:hypothetical protein